MELCTVMIIVFHLDVNDIKRKVLEILSWFCLGDDAKIIFYNANVVSCRSCTYDSTTDSKWFECWLDGSA